MRMSILIAVVFICLSALAGDSATSPSSTAIDVRSENLLLQPPAANWISYNGDYSGRRFSGLAEINPGNLAGLHAEWVFHARNTSRLEVTPVVVNGIMFITAANDASALDARTGRVVWHHSWPVSEGLIDDASGHINRGIGLWHDRVYMETDNAHLLCLDVRSGNLIWDVAYADWNKNYGATSAPLVVKDKVLVGTSGGDDGVRGFVSAYDAMTGKLAWRFWTIPGPGEFGSESWPGKLYLHGGGTTWMPGTYDPQLNLIYWHQQSRAGLRRWRAFRRRSLHRLRVGSRPRYWKTEMVFSIHAARSVRLRRGGDPDSDRCEVSGVGEKAAGAGKP